jgi:hypothetical protein
VLLELWAFNEGLSSLAWGGLGIPTAPVERAFLLQDLSPTCLMREEPCGLSLRASSDHRFIVGALRARRLALAPVDSLRAALLDFEIQF